MLVSSVERPVSALRQRMLEDMAMRGLRSATQRDYIRFVHSFTGFLRRPPDTATAEDIRRQAYLEVRDSVKEFGEACRRELKRLYREIS